MNVTSDEESSMQADAIEHDLPFVKDYKLRLHAALSTCANAGKGPPLFELLEEGFDELVRLQEECDVVGREVVPPLPIRGLMLWVGTNVPTPAEAQEVRLKFRRRYPHSEDTWIKMLEQLLAAYPEFSAYRHLIEGKPPPSHLMHLEKDEAEVYLVTGKLPARYT